ncbi:MAG TPA: NAD(P)/FAD-dependent oxidoreductase [Candidatus Binatia bacterium]|nr:NAD(P)/FAD-dependent oxidoreductase [Candidatus Binatia bacterium]
MSQTRDIIIIGAGHNGLVTAFYLAKAGFRPLVLESRPIIGGCAITEEFHPGFRCSRLAHATGPIRPEIVAEMDLPGHGLRTYTPAVRVLSLAHNGHLTLYGDLSASQQEIARFSPHDAAGYASFQQVLHRLGTVAAQLMNITPPDIDDPAAADLWELLKTGRKLRGLGDRDLYRVLRWTPMPVADLVSEWFETELLRGTVAAQGIFGTCLGPRSAGSSATLLLRSASDSNLAGAATYAVSGTGALAAAMAAAAQAAGAEIRVSSEVAQILVRDGAATGVVLSTGDELQARAVVSNADPKRTLLGLVEPQFLEPSFLQRLLHYRMHGTVAKVNLVLGALPKFEGVDGDVTARLSGRIQISPQIDYLERAFDASKYGEFSQSPYIEATIPTLWDTSLAPAGRHVMSICMQYAPYKLRNADWDSQRDALGDVVVDTLAGYAPDLPSLIEACDVITPSDLEQTWGLTGGHIFHGELALDQLFTMRPLLDWAQYRTPIRNLYLCGSGTHPGTGLTGASGANAAREILKDLRQKGRPASRA